MLELFNREGLVFSFADGAKGYISNDTFEESKDVKIKKGEGFIVVVKSFNDTPPDMGAPSWAPALAFPSGLEINKPLFQTKANTNKEKAIRNAFETAQLINDCGVIIQDTQYQDSLWVPCVSYSHSAIGDLHGSEILSIGCGFRLKNHEKFRLAAEDFNYIHGRYILGDGRVLFEAETNMRLHDLGQMVSVRRYLLEAYSYLDKDECMGVRIEKGKYYLMAARTKGGDIKMREIPDFHANDLI